jgi:hypothetical protein
VEGALLGVTGADTGSTSVRGRHRGVLSHSAIPSCLGMVGSP